MSAAAILVLIATGSLPASAKAAPPTITDTTFSAITTTSATLEASINPGAKATLYRFEYGTADCESNPCTAVPVPDAPVGNGTADVGVSAEVSGLTPGTTYHFRVVARNGDAPAGIEGPDTTFTTFALPPTFGPCPNDKFRTGPSARLSDCRAYEQVSPIDKNGADVAGGQGQIRASIDGDRITFFTTAGLPGGVGGQDFPLYVASRTPEGWSTQGLLPPPSFGTAALVNGWTPDLSQTFSLARKNTNEATFLSRSADGSISTIFPHTAGADARIVGASADGNLVYFQSNAVLAPGAISGEENLYLWQRDTGQLSLAGLLPDSACGSPPCGPVDGAFAGSYDWWVQNSPERSASNALYYLQDQHALSADGERLFFTEGGTGQLYLRDHPPGPAAMIAHVSASRRTDCAGDPTCGGDGQPDLEPDPLGPLPAQFQAASPDGSFAFFTSAEELTDDANTGPPPPGAPAIARADKVDGSAKELAFLPTRARGIAVAGEHIYWANPEDETIGRATLNEEGPAAEVDEDFVSLPEIEVESGVLVPSNPQYVAVDDEHLYWTNAADGEDHHGTIGRAHLDAGGELVSGSVDQGFITGASNPQGIAVRDEPGHEKIYWANNGSGSGNCREPEEFPGCTPITSRGLGRADLDGTDPEQVFVDNRREIHGIAVNAGNIFAAENEVNNGGRPSILSRYDLEGDAVGLFGDGFPPEEPARFRGIAIDGSHVYWAGQGRNAIGRHKLDILGGESAEDREFIQAAGNPLGVAVDNKYIYWTANQEVPPAPGSDLYRYDADTGELADLTPLQSEENGADVQGVIGASTDGSHVYFAANGDLDDAGPALPGDCGTSGSSAVGSCSLYLWHAGEITFIARLDAGADGMDQGGFSNWKPSDSGKGFEDRTGRVSADGSTLLFMSKTQLTPYDNRGHAMLYRYSTADPLTCVSCNPTGTPPSAGVTLALIRPTGQVAPDSGATTLLRNLSADGNRVFFETGDKLLGVDTNGDDGCPLFIDDGSFTRPSCLDVYMWEAEGTGTCEIDPGCLYLISTGASPHPSYFADASASGDQAFIFTRDQLVPQDTDQIQDVYAASVQGGLASQHAPPPQICLSGEECRSGATGPPQIPGAGSAALQGSGNGAGEGPDAAGCRQLAVKAKSKLRAAHKAEGRRARKLRRQAKGLKRKARRCRQRAAA